MLSTRLLLKPSAAIYMLAPVTSFSFASRYQMKRLTADRQRLTMPNPEDLKLVLPVHGEKPPRKATVKVHTTKRRALFEYQPTPIHDFINFKNMTGNEILLNLDNHKHFAITELLGALHELSTRPTPKRIDWMTHPIVAGAMAHLKDKISGMTAKQLVQVPIILHKLSWSDRSLWQLCQTNILRLLHKYKARDMAYFLDVFDRDFLDQEGEPYFKFARSDDVFFERIVAILPMFIPNFSREQLLRTFEVLTKKKIGSDRLFNNYIYLQIERQIYSFTGKQYCRLLRTLANKGYQEDKVFWNDYVFDYVRTDDKGQSKGNFNKADAERIWDLLVLIKIQLPTLDVSEPMSQLVKYIPAAKQEEAASEE